MTESNRLESGHASFKVPTLLFTGIFTTYILTLSNSHFADALSAASQVQYPGPPISGNHILFPFVPTLLHRALVHFGWTGSTLLTVQVFNALCGAIAVTMMYLVSLTITRNTRVSLWIAIGFGFSAGVWIYSVDAKNAVMPLAFGLFYLYILLQNRYPNRTYTPLILSSICVVAIAIYETGVFLVAVTAIGFLLNPALNRRDRVKQLVIFTASTIFLTASVLLSVAHVFCGVNSLHDFINWEFAYSRLELWGKPSLKKTIRGLSSMLKSITFYPGFNVNRRVWFAGASVPQRIASFVIFGAAMLALAVLITETIRCRSIIMHRYLWESSMVATWAVLNGLFSLYWTQTDLSFSIPVLASGWILVGILISARSDSASVTQNSGMAARATDLLAFSVVAITIVNLGAVYNNLKPDCPYRIAQAIGESTTSDDLIIDSGADPALSVAIPYFAHRKTISVFLWFLGSLGPPSNPWVIPDPRPRDARYGLRRGKQYVFEGIDRVANETRARGGRVFSIGAYRGQDDQWSDPHVVGFTEQDFSRFQGRRVWTVCGEDLLEIR